VTIIVSDLMFAVMLF